MRGQHGILSLPLPGASRVIWSPLPALGSLLQYWGPWEAGRTRARPGRERCIRRWRLGRLWRLANDRAGANGPESQSLRNSLEGGAGPPGRGTGMLTPGRVREGPGVWVSGWSHGDVEPESLPCFRDMSCPRGSFTSSAGSSLSTYCAPHSRWALSTQWAPPRAALPSGPAVCWGRGLQWVTAGHSGRGDEGRPGALGAPGGPNPLFRVPGRHLGLVMTGR